MKHKECYYCEWLYGVDTEPDQTTHSHVGLNPVELFSPTTPSLTTSLEQTPQSAALLKALWLQWSGSTDGLEAASCFSQPTNTQVYVMYLFM